MIPLEWELALSAILFVIGLYGILVRRNGIIVLMSVEIVLNAAILNFVAFSVYARPADPGGQVLALFSISLAAAEAAVGLAIFLVLYKAHGTIDLDRVRILRW